MDKMKTKQSPIFEKAMIFVDANNACIQPDKNSDISSLKNPEYAL